MVKTYSKNAAKAKVALGQLLKASIGDSEKIMLQNFIQQYKRAPVLTAPFVDDDLKIKGDDITWRVMDGVRLPYAEQILDFPLASFAFLKHVMPSSIAFTPVFFVKESDSQSWYVEALIMAELIADEDDLLVSESVIDIRPPWHALRYTFVVKVADNRIEVGINARDNQECAMWRMSIIRTAHILDSMTKTREFYHCTKCDRRNDECAGLEKLVYFFAFAVVKGICCITMPGRYKTASRKAGNDVVG